MRTLIDTLPLVNGRIATVALWIAGFGLVLMTGFIAAQVFWRYVLNDSLTWTEPASIMVMGWFIFLGAAVGVRENFHMGFDVLVHFLPASAGPWMRAISDIAVLVFGLGMTIYGAQLAYETWNSLIPLLHLPKGSSYLPLVAGGLLISLFAIERLLLRLAGVVVDHDPNAEDILVTEV